MKAVGWPPGLPVGRIRNWPIHVVFSVAVMLLKGSIFFQSTGPVTQSIDLLSRRERIRSSMQKTAARVVDSSHAEGLAFQTLEEPIHETMSHIVSGNVAEVPLRNAMNGHSCQPAKQVDSSSDFSQISDDSYEWDDSSEPEVDSVSTNGKDKLNDVSGVVVASHLQASQTLQRNLKSLPRPPAIVQSCRGRCVEGVNAQRRSSLQKAAHVTLPSSSKKPLSSSSSSSESSLERDDSSSSCEEVTNVKTPTSSLKSVKSNQKPPQSSRTPGMRVRFTQGGNNASNPSGVRNRSNTTLVSKGAVPQSYKRPLSSSVSPSPSSSSSSPSSSMSSSSDSSSDSDESSSSDEANAKCPNPVSKGVTGGQDCNRLNVVLVSKGSVHPSKSNNLIHGEGSDSVRSVIDVDSLLPSMASRVVTPKHRQVDAQGTPSLRLTKSSNAIRRARDSGSDSSDSVVYIGTKLASKAQRQKSNHFNQPQKRAKHAAPHSTLIAETFKNPISSSASGRRNTLQGAAVSRYRKEESKKKSRVVLSAKIAALKRRLKGDTWSMSDTSMLFKLPDGYM